MRKKWYFPKEKGIFSSRRWTNNALGGDHDLRTSTSIRQRPIQRENHLGFLGDSEGSLPLPHDSFPDAGEAINDFWSMSENFIYRHHVEPRVKLYSPREESIPIPLQYLDVTRTTHTNLDVKQEKRIDDFGISMGQEICLIHGQVSLSLLYWKKNQETDICGSVGDINERKLLTSRPDHLWPELWKNMRKNAKLQGEAKVITWKTTR